MKETVIIFQELFGAITFERYQNLGYDGLAGASGLITRGVWSVFVFTIISAIGLLLTEVSADEPKTVV